MNKLEKEMFNLLLELKEKYNVFSVKAEFEAEGTRDDDLLRLVDIVKRSDLKLTIKIGGCEAIRDLIECKQLGVDRIVAPMIESEYALKKFQGAINQVYSHSDIEDTEFLFNVETISAYKNIEPLSDVVQSTSNIDGIVFGRVDFCGSLGLSREDINSEEILKYCQNVSTICKDRDMTYVIGGGVSNDSYLFLKSLSQIRLDSFETRKIIFNSDILKSDLKDAIKLAVKYELAYLKNKSNYYQMIASEDKSRIEMLEKRVLL